MSVGLSVCNAFVRRSTCRTSLAYLALFFNCFSILGIADGYFQRNDSNFYKIHEKAETFADAKSVCMQEDATLVMEDDPLTREVLKPIWTQMKSQFWLGAQRNSSLPAGVSGVDNFVWMNDQPISISSWDGCKSDWNWILN